MSKKFPDIYKFLEPKSTEIKGQILAAVEEDIENFLREFNFILG